MSYRIVKTLDCTAEHRAAVRDFVRTARDGGPDFRFVRLTHSFGIFYWCFLSSSVKREANERAATEAKAQLDAIVNRSKK